MYTIFSRNKCICATINIISGRDFPTAYNCVKLLSISHHPAFHRKVAEIGKKWGGGIRNLHSGSKQIASMIRNGFSSRGGKSQKGETE